MEDKQEYTIGDIRRLCETTINQLSCTISNHIHNITAGISSLTQSIAKELHKDENETKTKTEDKAKEETSTKEGLDEETIRLKASQLLKSKD